jgi:anti-sigma factor RsiW
MDCALVRNHLDAYVDGELEPSPSATLETHLHACPVCQGELTMSRALKRAVHDLPRPGLPESVRANVIRGLDQAERGKDMGRRGLVFSGGLAVAAAALLAVIATKRPEPPPVASNDPQSAPMLVREVVARHTDQLPVDIADTRSEQMSAWLSGKLGFRVRPVEFPQADVRLMGGRVSNVGGQPAARLNYTVGNARLTVLVFQPPVEAQRLLHEDDDAVSRSGGRRVRVGAHLVTYHSVRGYTVPMLEQGGLAYAFASDLDEQSLLRLIGSARLP